MEQWGHFEREWADTNYWTYWSKKEWCSPTSSDVTQLFEITALPEGYLPHQILYVSKTGQPISALMTAVRFSARMADNPELLTNFRLQQNFHTRGGLCLWSCLTFIINIPSLWMRATDSLDLYRLHMNLHLHPTSTQQVEETSTICWCIDQVTSLHQSHVTGEFPY
jgi:hypothetical protein